MSDGDGDVVNAVELLVNSGFYDDDEILEHVDYQFEGEVDEDRLQALIAAASAQKRAAELDWPATTDCDRLDAAFLDLAGQGIIALQNSGYTMSNGHDDVAEARAEWSGAAARGYCFYHGQDLERAVHGEGVMLAFGAFQDEDAAAVAIGQEICSTLLRHGLSAQWKGSKATRINILPFAWQRRYRPAED